MEWQLGRRRARAGAVRAERVNADDPDSCDEQKCGDRRIKVGMIEVVRPPEAFGPVGPEQDDRSGGDLGQLGRDVGDGDAPPGPGERGRVDEVHGGEESLEVEGVDGRAARDRVRGGIQVRARVCAEVEAVHCDAVVA